MITHFRPTLAFILLLGSACADPDGPTRTPTPRPLTVTPSQGADEVEAMVKPRFETTLRIDGSFQPGGVLRVTGHVVANFATRASRISLVMPEVRAASANNWIHARAESGRAVAPEKVLVVPLGAGQGTDITSDVLIPVEGVYRAMVIATKTSDEPNIENGTRTENVVVGEAWFAVRKGGGGVRASWGDASGVFPQARSLIAGPYVPPSRSTVKPAVQGGGIHHLGYYDVDQSASVPLGGIVVTLTLRDPATWEEFSYGNTVTQPDGSFLVPCPQPIDWEVSYTARLETPDFWVPTGYESTPVGVQQGNGCDIDNATIEPVPNTFAKVFRNLQTIVPASRSFFQYTRGWIEVDLVAGSGQSSYSPSNDKITLRGGVWGDDGKFIQSHEYGHALHYRALGAANSSSQCPSPHYYDRPSNMACAFDEGFANYHAFATWGTQIYQTMSWGEANIYFQSGDGSLYESAFAALLYDLSDPANEPTDQVQFTGNYVASLIRNCRLGSFKPAATDDFVHCLENSTWGQNQYFPTRRIWPQSVAPNVPPPSGWNLNSVRLPWLYDLYRQTTLPPTAPPITLQIAGPASVRPRATCLWSAQAGGGAGSYSYVWKVNNQPVGANAPDLTYANAGSGFTVQVTVTSGTLAPVTKTLAVAVSASASICSS